MKFIKLDGVFPGQDAPRVDLPASVLASEGSMFLIDPTHPANPWPEGVPTGLLPNIAYGEATAWNANATQYAADMIPGSGTVTFERTPKGGLHGIPPLVDSSAYGGMALADWIRNQVRNYPGHAYFMGLHARPTRAAVAGAVPNIQMLFVDSTSPTSSYLASLSFRDTAMASYPNENVGTVTLIGHSLPTYTPGRVIAGDIAVSQWNGTPPSTFGATQGRIGWGKHWVGTNANELPAWILYGAYMEDLTVSGRTYSEVSAAWAAYCEHARTTRYQGDTWTTP